MPNYTTTPIDLTFGTDAGTDPKVAKGLLKLENATYDKEGAVEKRRGVNRAESGNSGQQLYLGEVDGRRLAISPGVRLQREDAETMQTLDGTTLLVKADISRFHDRASALPLETEYAYLKDRKSYLVAFADADRLQHTLYIRDLVNGDFYDENIGSDASVTDGPAYVRLAVAGDGLVYVVFWDEAAHRIKYRTVTASTFAPAVTITGFTTSTTYRLFDACVTQCQNGDHVLSIIAVDSANNVRIVQVLNNSTTSYAGASTTDYITAVCAAPFGDGTTFFGWATRVTASGAVSCVARVYDESAVQAVTSATLLSGTNGDYVSRIAALPATAGTSISAYVEQCHNYSTWSTANYDYPILTPVTYTNTAGTGSASAGDALYHMRLASKPFTLGPNACAVLFWRQYKSGAPNLRPWVGYISENPSLQNSLVVYSFTALRVLAVLTENMAPAGHAVHGSPRMFVPSVYQANSPTLVQAEQLRLGEYGNVYPLNLIALNTDYARGPSIVPLGDSSTVGCSAPLLAPKSGVVVPHGYLQYPELVTQASTGAGTGLTAGTYNFRAVYEDISAGLVMRSAPTPNALVVTLGGAVTDIHVNVPNIGKKVVVYRTLCNGSIFYRCAESAAAPTGAYVNVECGLTDAQISAREVLYTDTGEQPDDPPPPYWIACLHQNRLVVVDLYKSSVHYSKKLVPGYVPAFATATNYFDLPGTAGTITALISLGDKLLVCTASKIYATEGEGYNNDGSGLNYREPFIISHAVGCESHKGIVWVNDGVLFKSQDIIYRIDAGLGVQPIGEPVRYYTDTYSVKGTSSNAAKHYVQFHTDGPSLVYDWLRDRWSTFTYHECVDALGIGDRSFWLRPVRNTYYDLMGDWSTETYYDNVITGNNPTPGTTPTWIGTKIDTGWIKLAENARYYRVQFIGQNLSSHTLRCRVAYNYDPTWTDNLTLSSAATTAFGTSSYMGTGEAAAYKDQAYVPEIHLSRQLAQAIRIEISDEYRSAWGSSWTLSKLVLFSKPKPDIYRRAPARRF